MSIIPYLPFFPFLSQDKKKREDGFTCKWPRSRKAHRAEACTHPIGMLKLLFQTSPPL